MSELTGIVLAGLPIGFLGLYAMFRRPKLYFFLYILLTTQIFGFLPMNVGLMTPAMLFFVHLAMVFHVIFRLIQGRRIDERPVRYFLLVVAGLWLFGCVYPWIMGYSSLGLSVVNGKDFLGYVGIPYLLVNREEFDVEYLGRLFTGVGAILVIILVVGRITGFVPPCYYLHEEKNFIHVNHIMYFTLGAFLALSRWVTRWRPRDAAIFLFLGMGIVLQGHRALLIVAIFTMAWMVLLRGALPVRAKKVLAVVVILVMTMIGLGAMGFSNPLFERSTTLVALPEDPLSGRENANVTRYMFIFERPLLGYGFISKDSTLGNYAAGVAVGHFDESFAVIDSGYVDLVIRFGIVGAVLFMAAFLNVLTRGWMRLSTLGHEQTSVLLLLTGYAVVHYTWAVLTYEHGIVAGSVAIFILNINIHPAAGQVEPTPVQAAKPPGGG